jgi:hypothetical protein
VQETSVETRERLVREGLLLESTGMKAGERASYTNAGWKNQLHVWYASEKPTWTPELILQHAGIITYVVVGEVAVHVEGEGSAVAVAFTPAHALFSEAFGIEIAPVAAPERLPSKQPKVQLSRAVQGRVAPVQA